MSPSAGNRIRSYRTLREWSIRQLAKKSGLKKSVLHRIETGQQEPRASQLEKVSKAFGLSMVEFYGGERVA
jgi:transcriptional regulator with XRE-family HTH domain